MRRNRILGPIILITIGVLFALDNIWGIADFWRFWPVLLIVIGVVKLVDRLGYDDRGSYYGQPRPWGPASPPPPPPPPTAPGTMNHTESGDGQNVS
jgi:hypothetical protein